MFGIGFTIEVLARTLTPIPWLNQSLPQVRVDKFDQLG